MKTCAFCNKLKTLLDGKQIQYITKDSAEHVREWEEVRGITLIPMFPTIKIKDNYYIPQRDFQTVEQGAHLIETLISSSTPLVSTDNNIIEGIKTINGSINILGQRLTSLQNTINRIVTLVEEQKNSESTTPDPTAPTNLPYTPIEQFPG